jgi:protein-S-isoprenylcysteine O-methyltransferase Ste14
MNENTFNFLASIFLLLMSIRIGFVIFKRRMIIGISPINPYLFIVAKILALLIICSPLINQFNQHMLLAPGKIIYIFGLILLTISLYNLNHQSLTMGLPSNSFHLQTNGFYRFTRNPIYFSLYIVFLGSIFITHSFLVILFVVISIVIHHQIILKEEKFLSETFGDVWSDYQSKVARYFPPF